MPGTKKKKLKDIYYYNYYAIINIPILLPNKYLLNISCYYYNDE